MVLCWAVGKPRAGLGACDLFNPFVMHLVELRWAGVALCCAVLRWPHLFLAGDGCAVPRGAWNLIPSSPR